jgi:hypothetical protein
MFVFAYLGEEQPSPQKAGGDAALAEAEKRNFGTSKEDVEAYGAAAGAAGAVAACCAAGGVGCAAAPLCGVIGGEIGGAIAGAIYDLFTDDAPEGIASNQTEDWKIVWNSGQRRDAFRMFALGCIEEIRGKKFQFNSANLKAQDAVMAPIMLKLIKWPWKKVPQPGINPLPVPFPAPKTEETWSSWIGRLGDYVGASHMAPTYAMDAVATQYMAALTVTSGNIIGERAGEPAKLKLMLGPFSPATPYVARRSIVKPVLVTAAAGAALWWAYTTL